MPTLITLTEAATFLGVSKATLRNWDNDGKLVAVRNPINGYRQYDMESLIKLKNEMTGQENSLKKQNDELKSEEAKAIKRAVNKLHSIIRDSDANSNIVTRFDEISKLLFVRLMSGRNIFKGFEQKDALYSSKIQEEYRRLLNESGRKIPKSYLKINLDADTIRLCGKELYSLLIDDCQCDILRANTLYRLSCQINCNNLRHINIVSTAKKLLYKLWSSLTTCHCSKCTIACMAV